MRQFLRGRSVVELMVLTITLVVAVSVLMGGATVAYLEYRDPSLDYSPTEEHLFNLISTMLGALLGLITGTALARRQDPPEDHPEDHPGRPPGP